MMIDDLWIDYCLSCKERATVQGWFPATHQKI